MGLLTELLLCLLYKNRRNGKFFEKSRILSIFNKKFNKLRIHMMLKDIMWF
jgi:hypothetical protein